MYELSSSGHGRPLPSPSSNRLTLASFLPCLECHARRAQGSDGGGVSQGREGDGKFAIFVCCRGMGQQRCSVKGLVEVVMV